MRDHGDALIQEAGQEGPGVAEVLAERLGPLRDRRADLEIPELARKLSMKSTTRQREPKGAAALRRLVGEGRSNARANCLAGRAPAVHRVPALGLAEREMVDARDALVADAAPTPAAWVAVSRPGGPAGGHIPPWRWR